MHRQPFLPDTIDELKTLLLAQSDRLAQMHAVISNGDWFKLRPLPEAFCQHMFAAEKRHANDTPIAVLMSGNNKTWQGWLGAYVRDDRPVRLQSPPAVWFWYLLSRKGIHPQTHLQNYAGTLQVEAYAGYHAIHNTKHMMEVGCWANAQRKFHDIHLASATPETTHVLTPIATLYKIETGTEDSPVDHRREARQAFARPTIAPLHRWLTEQRSTLSRKAAGAMNAITFVINQWQALTPYPEDFRIKIDNNATRPALRGVALSQKNYLFPGIRCRRRTRRYDLQSSRYGPTQSHQSADLSPSRSRRDGDYPVNRVGELLHWNVTL